MLKKENEKMDFQIVHHYIDMNELTLKRLPVSYYLGMVYELYYCNKTKHTINMGWWNSCYKKVSDKSSIVCQIISKIMAILTLFLASCDSHLALHSFSYQTHF